MIKISPSLLAADIANLQSEISKIEEFTDMLHIDVMDGHFVPNISYGVPVVKAIRRITKAFLDVHLMIEKPSLYIKSFADAGSDLITIHVEAPDDIGACLKLIKSLGLKSGIALNPDTSPEKILPFIQDVDMVLQMTVFPGFGGQGMIDSAIENIPVIRKIIGPDKDLQVDGGIYKENCARVVKAGANVIVSGTGVFGQSDTAKAIADLRSEAESI